MDPSRPSATALSAALLRAAHQLLDVPRVLDDPLALRIVGEEAAAAVRAAPEKFDVPRLRPLRAFLAVRSRYAEDCVAEAFAAGTRQMVILGAGLDTFAFRNPHPGLRVFEVDHPATQAWKRELVTQWGIALPPALGFVPLDLERESLAPGLRQAGWRADQPSCFTWLGVAAYLTPAAVLTTLRALREACCPGSSIVFSIATQPSAVAERAAAKGEPWLSYFDPAALLQELKTMGYTDASDFSPQDANARYFAGRSDGLRVSGGGHLVLARV